VEVAIVGCGTIGTRRAEVAAAKGDRILAVADLDEARARQMAERFHADWSTNWRDVVAPAPVDAVVVATVTSALAPIVIEALRQGKHVLCEKPMGRTADEAGAIARAARQSGRCLKVGFNHRHHPAVSRAHDLAVSGRIGRVLAIRAAYGHGGRPGYEREWRCDPAVAGGGELLDQGVHLIDLARWFLGDFTQVSGAVATWFWPIQPLEDNAFALLSTADGRVATIHVSWTQWRNIFRFEILGSEGYLVADGLGGNYGVERLTHGRRQPDWSGPLEEQWEFPAPDPSWSDEWLEFSTAIRERRKPLGSAEDGYAAALLVDAIYRSARSGGSTVKLAS